MYRDGSQSSRDLIRETKRVSRESGLVVTPLDDGVRLSDSLGMAYRPDRLSEMFL